MKIKTTQIILDGNRPPISGSISEFRLAMKSVPEDQLKGKTKQKEPMWMQTSIVDQAPFIERLAIHDDPVLISGPSGSGKENLARTIHRMSNRSKKKFLAINCGGVSETLLLSELFGHEKGSFTGAATDRKGAVEIADGGTLFLDEIGDLPPMAQIALLRFLNGEGEYHKLGAMGKESHSKVRIICATNKDLQKEIKDGKFREDLYYRINIFALSLQSIAPINDCMLDNYHLQYFHFYAIEGGLVKEGEHSLHLLPEMSPAARKILKNYDYPGNFRELKNIFRYVFAHCDGKVIRKEDLPDYILRPGSIHKGNDLLDLPADKFRAAINDVIYKRLSMEVEQAGNVEKAAKTFDMYSTKFTRKLENARSGKIL